LICIFNSFVDEVLLGIAKRDFIQLGEGVDIKK
jgi:hypothetical protein